MPVTGTEQSGDKLYRNISQAHVALKLSQVTFGDRWATHGSTQEPPWPNSRGVVCLLQYSFPQLTLQFLCMYPDLQKHLPVPRIPTEQTPCPEHGCTS